MDDAGLVVAVHQGNHHRIGANETLQSLHVDRAVSQYRSDADLCSTAFDRLKGLEDSFVLGSADDEMLALDLSVAPEDAFDGEIDGFGGARGEDYFLL